MSLVKTTPLETAQAAKAASHVLATLPTAARNSALTAIHLGLSGARDAIMAANARDLAAARQAAADGRLSSSLVSRLDLSKPGKWEEMLRGILDVRDLPDPVGQVDLRTRLDEGLELERVACPIGVLLVIFEARPEVVANIAALAIKSGNAAILKGGRESTESCMAIAGAIAGALAVAAYAVHVEDASADGGGIGVGQSSSGGGDESPPATVPADVIQLVTTRDVIPQLLALDRHVDLVIPRGSNELVRYVKENTKIPVLGHADGLCAAFLERSADPDMAAAVVVDAKTSYPAACNSLETLLVEADALHTAWPSVAAALLRKGVELRCDAPSKAALSPATATEGQGAQQQEIVIKDAQEADYDTEFLSLVLAVKTVGSAEEAIAHINARGSHHTDVVLTGSRAVAERFMDAVDSAGVYWNASTRFADGTRYGFGTEVGISTNKIHARGPVGLEGLMIYKYKVRGAGHVTAAYGEGEGKKKYLHENLPL